ncbi:DsbA family protein [Rhodobacteraceae bacterium]|nr:DsbA family protein [Paracoccaceae bacterium]
MIARRNFLIIASAALAAPSGSYADPLAPDMVFHDPDAPALGHPQGDVTLVEFFDYQCPYCKRNHPVVEEVMAQDPGLRLVMKDWPVFGPVSRRASQLVLGAHEGGGYETALNALMATQARLSNQQVDKALKDAGIQVGAAERNYENASKKIDALLVRNDTQATGLGFFGTPGFVAGRTLYPGALDRKALMAAIQSARSGR